MKLTKSQLKQIIKEELQNALQEGFSKTVLRKLEDFNNAFDVLKGSGIIGASARTVLSALKQHSFVDFKRENAEDYDSMKIIANEILANIGSIPNIPFGGWKGGDAPSAQEQSLHRLGRFLQRLVRDDLVTSLDPSDPHYARASLPSKRSKKSKFLGLFNEE